eukprot:g860.t1
MSTEMEAVLLATQKRLALVEDELREQRRQAAENAELAGRALRVKDEEIAVLTKQLSMSNLCNIYGGNADGTSEHLDMNTGEITCAEADDANDDGEHDGNAEGTRSDNPALQRGSVEKAANNTYQCNNAEGGWGEGIGGEQDDDVKKLATAVDIDAGASESAWECGRGKQSVRDGYRISRQCAHDTSDQPDAAISAVMGQLTRVYQLLEEERRVRAAAEQQVEELQEEMCEMRALCSLRTSEPLRPRRDSAESPHSDACGCVSKSSGEDSPRASALPAQPPPAPWEQIQGFHPPPPFDMNSPVVMELLRTATGGNRHQAQAARRWLRHVESGAELTDAFPLEMTFCMLTSAVCDGFVKLVAPMLKRRPDVTITVFTRRSQEGGEKLDVRLAVVPVQHDLDLNLTSLELTAAVLPEQSPLTRKPSTPTPTQASHGSRPWGPKSPIVTNTTADAGSGAAICATDAVAQLSSPTRLSPSLSSGSDVDLEGDCDTHSSSMWVGE